MEQQKHWEAVLKNRRDKLCVLAGAVLLTMAAAASPALADDVSMPSVGGVETVTRSIQDHIWFQNQELSAARNARMESTRGALGARRSENAKLSETRHR